MRKSNIAVAALGAALGVTGSSQAAFILGGGEQFAVLGQFSNNQTNLNNGAIVGDIGIGSPRQATFSNIDITGNLRFSGATNVTGLSPDPDPAGSVGPFTVSGGGTFTGIVIANDPLVTLAINNTNSLSQNFGAEPGTDLTLTSTQTILASSGILDGTGNRVFDTTAVSLGGSTTLTISGLASDYVVINVTDNNPMFKGQIVLTGGIVSDHVLFNMFGGNYTTHTGGPTLTINTNGQTVTGTFLDPNGAMSMDHSVLNGRFFGGDTVNQQIVSGAFINAPTPEPAAGALAAIAGLTLTAHRRRRTR
jgi:MYXO-CTERM domain-containing protein